MAIVSTAARRTVPICGPSNEKLCGIAGGVNEVGNRRGVVMDIVDLLGINASVNYAAWIRSTARGCRHMTSIRRS
jgi:hypothetical protein